MENWKDKIKRGDIAVACRRVGVSATVYHESKKITPGKWTSGMYNVNIELKRMIRKGICCLPNR